MSSSNPATIYIRLLDSPNSISSVKRGLNRFAKWLTKNEKASYLDIPWANIDFELMQNYREALITEDKSPDTIATYLSYIKSVIRVAATLTTVDPRFRIPHSTLLEIAQGIKPPKRSGELANRFVPLDEFNMLVRSSDDGTNAGKRDCALLHLLYGCGLRRSEMINLNLNSIVWERQALKVVGKGNKTRSIPLFSDLENTLENYLRVRGEMPGPLFHRVSSADRLLTDKRLSVRGLVHIIEQRCTKAGIERYNAHSFRASFATTHFIIGTDLLTIQNLMGHSSPTTTKRYDLRDFQAGADAMDIFGEHMRQA